MLVNFNGMLRKAQQEKYAVGSFNVYNYETMKGVVLAASELGQPVIVAFGAKYLSNMSLGDAASMARTLAEESGAEICLHLDHCSDTALIFQAIRAGFSSVMYDGSALPFEANVKNTMLVCAAAHACGVSVEAELGSIAAGESSHEGSAADIEAYTDPVAANEFAATTGCDALAVSVGTVHGLYKSAPHIRLDLLGSIRRRVKQPLVLHGGSGIPEETIKQCIAGGICKINVNTEISMYTVEKTAELLQTSAPAPHLAVIAEKQRQFVREAALKYMRFFGKD